MTLKELLSIAVESNASDLHIAVGKPPILRINGELMPIKDKPVIGPDLARKMIQMMLPKEKFAKFQNDRELDISYQASEAYRFRVNLHYERGNMGLVARVIPSEPPTMEDIYMPQVVYNLLDLKQGLILVTGPTGCGKSTSMAAMIEYINANQKAHIVTLEDPIEFIFHSKKSILKQRQLGTDMKTFSSALKHVVRQDPNVVMVGEMRDLETIATTITIAETGHLVIATLHTLSAAQTIDRIIDVFPPYQQEQVRMQLSLFLKGVVAQQLLPRKEGDGRVATREILINNSAVGNLIRENKIGQIRTVIQTSAEEGMVTMDQDLKRLVKEGKITEATAKTYLTSPHFIDDDE